MGAQKRVDDALKGWDPDAFAEDAQEKADELFDPINEQITGLVEQAGSIPTFEEWLAAHPEQGLSDYSQPIGQIQGLIDRWQNGPSAGDYDSAFAHAARLTGLSPEEWSATMAELTRTMSGNINDMPGLSEDEQTMMRRQNQANLRDMEARTLRIVQDTMADTGSTARMLQTAAEYGNQINNAQIAQDYALVQADGERRVMQLQSAQQSWAAMMQAGEIGVDQYLNNLQEGASLAFQGYATQVQTMMANDQQLFSQHRADLDSMVAGINATYQALQLQLGATVAEIDVANSLYKSLVQPYLDDLQMILTEQETTFGWDDVWDGIVTVVGVALSVGTKIVSGMNGIEYSF